MARYSIEILGGDTKMVDAFYYGGTSLAEARRTAARVRRGLQQNGSTIYIVDGRTRRCIETMTHTEAGGYDFDSELPWWPMYPIGRGTWAVVKGNTARVAATAAHPMSERRMLEMIDRLGGAYERRGFKQGGKFVFAGGWLGGSGPWDTRIAKRVR